MMDLDGVVVMVVGAGSNDASVGFSVISLRLHGDGKYWFVKFG